MEELNYYKNLYYGGGKTQNKKVLSRFFGTINPNKRDTPEYREHYSDVLVDFFENVDDFIKVRKGWKWDDDMDIEIIFDNEIGDKQHRLHTHFLIKVYHKSNIQIDTNKARKFFQDNLTNGKKIHFNVEGSGDKNGNLTDEQAMINYIYKSKGKVF